MSAPTTDYATIERTVRAQGFAVHGGFEVALDDDITHPSHTQPARALVLVGMARDIGWPAFQASAEFSDGEPDPLDRFTRARLQSVATVLDAFALFPFGGPPHWPFQAWALQAQPVVASPLGLLLHARYGLWHGYRGALAFTRVPIGLPQKVDWQGACATCIERPCLSACPVDAFSVRGFDAERCASWLASQPQPCFAAGCLARAACPYAPHARYDEAQRQFHMRSFADSMMRRRQC